MTEDDIVTVQTTSKENVDEIANHLHSLMKTGFDDDQIEDYMRAMVGEALQDPAKIVECHYANGHLLIRYMPDFPNSIAEIDFSVHIKEGDRTDV